MAFKLNVAKTQNDDTSGREERAPRKEIDWQAYEAHIIAAAGTALKARSLPGVISGLIDLGIQNREPIEVPYSEEEAKKPGAVEFSQGGKKMLRVPRKACQQIALTVDFAGITVDRGQFFGESNPAPLRILLNGEFGVRVDGVWTPIVAKPYSVSEVKNDDGSWSFSKLNNIYKLADATDLLDEKGNFTKDRVGELLGKVAQFEVRVWAKPGTGGKTYLTEYIKLAGRVPEGISIPSYDDSLLMGVNLNGDNDPAIVKQLRKSIKNTIKRANNYAESDIKALIEEQEAAFTSAPRASTTNNVVPITTGWVIGTARPVHVGRSTQVMAANDDNWNEDEDGETPF